MTNESTNRGRPTIYKGIRMRSRLEASFAADLDDLGMAWEYEPMCFADKTGQYLPDFKVGDPRDTPAYYEIKPPTADTGAALLKMHIILASEPNAYLFVHVPTGNYPNQGWAQAAACGPKHRCAHCAGVPFRDLRTVPAVERRWKFSDIGQRIRDGEIPST